MMGAVISIHDIYRPQSLRRLCFYTCLLFCSHGGSASVHAGIPPRGQAPLGPPHPPRTRHPPGPGTPWDQTPWHQTPQPDQAPPPPADGYCCGRYASYWNVNTYNESHTTQYLRKINRNLNLTVNRALDTIQCIKCLTHMIVFLCSCTILPIRTLC